ncbi:hypothetical protein L207DRAFT_528140 [Hyaloscypha variabilis F]|uniref:Uncharacterized protein n=1 Tax=Hyaloscypha variabilis (strain UAMH 11265 / GT02V1 / F) TaxID=1149755 RepID=A0A2J6RSM4_HYAVF|nr:hypothetical protein L207DRAFT_528140 [Hyaloscypha variabilis F]
MAPQLPKEVVSAIEVAINIAYSQNKRPDLKGIAAIFNTSYEAVRYINCRIRTIITTGTYPKKKPGPKLLRGANQEEIEQCVRQIVEQKPEVQLKEIVSVVKERLDVELGTTTMSRFIKAKGIPFIGGQGGPPRNPYSKRNIKKTLAMSAAGGSESSGSRGAGSVEGEQDENRDENRPMYCSPYAPAISDQNAANLLSIYGRPGQDYVAYGSPYS